MAPKESIQHKRQKEKEKRQREEQEAQDILKSGRFVITQEREDLVAELARGTMGAKGPNLDTWRDGGREAGWAGGSGGGSVWVMPSVDVYENFLKRSQAVAGGRRPSQAVGTPMWWPTTCHM